MQESNKPKVLPYSTDYVIGQTATAYGTIPLHTVSEFSVRECVHLTLPRNLSDVDPTIVKLLRPYM